MRIKLNNLNAYEQYTLLTSIADILLTFREGLNPSSIRRAVLRDTVLTGYRRRLAARRNAA